MQVTLKLYASLGTYLRASAELSSIAQGFGKEPDLGSLRLCTKYGRPDLSMSVKGQEFPAYDSTGLCIFTTFGWTLNDIAPQVDAACEGDGSPERMLDVSERIWNMERRFNLRAGFTAKDDNLPPRLQRPARPRVSPRRCQSAISCAAGRWMVCRPTRRRLGWPSGHRSGSDLAGLNPRHAFDLPAASVTLRSARGVHQAHHRRPPQ